ncbi:hypothetical protein EMIHUDRAFT_202817 [Emiliania huxleyi CCMP1516]|nr:hypothetical protein EMIHUDRAFT_202817 [Emiliania huxleyi CCMP1516]EOD32187.1 hypothetical protein EMIHUDRAFT_202817 [Emiliania huxleyi CCMP1516]|eukprot:XP_005784616.1 hypothetical protein EMIHUDRAFT_202817 [Emiliania huxleyi CCMP1516]
MFEQIYKSGTWQHGNASLPLSGTGSTAEASANARIALAAALGRTRARSVLDAPCGDFTWMRLMLPTFARLGVHYTGVDIARPQIARLQAEFEGTAGVEFRVGDLVVEPPPRATAGLIFSREMTQHLNPEEVLRVLHHWSRSGSRYLLQTTYRLKDGSNRNFDRVSRGSHSMIDFERVPFSLPPPIASWVEDDTHTHTERLALWRLPLQTHVYGVAAEAGTQYVSNARRGEHEQT